MAKHRNNPNMPFWKMIKEGNDHFEVTRQEPKVDVCEKRYVFNAQRPAASIRSISARRAKCPAYEVPQEIAAAVYDKQRSDELQIARTRIARHADRADPQRPRRRHASDLRRQAPAAGRWSTHKGKIRLIVEHPAPGNTLPPPPIPEPATDSDHALRLPPIDRDRVTVCGRAAAAHRAASRRTSRQARRAVLRAARSENFFRPRAEARSADHTTRRHWPSRTAQPASGAAQD